MKPSNKFQIVGEMIQADPTSVPNSPLIKDINEVTGDDDDPMFVTVEVLNPQVSANKRRYNKELLYDLADQINDKLPDGYLGHMKDEDRGTATPESQTIWVGATVKEINGKLRLLAKGYVMPYAKKLRQYLKRAIGAGKQVAVSIYGEALQTFDSRDKVYDVSEFSLESIDWARAGSQGITGMIQPVIAREQKDDNMDKDEVLKEITLQELKDARPDLIQEIKDEIAAETPAKPTETHEMKDLRQIIGITEDADIKTVVKEMSDEISVLRESYIDFKVSENIKKDSMRGIFKRMVVGEMKGSTTKDVDSAIEAVLKSEEGKTFIKEMVTPKVTVAPQEDNRNQEPGRKYTKL